MSELMVFACSEDCAQQVWADNRAPHLTGYQRIHCADDLAGQELETIEIGKCSCRWNPALVTAWKHLEWCIWQLEPVEERWADEQRSHSSTSSLQSRKH